MNLLKLFKNNQAIILVLIATFPLVGYISSYFFQVGYFSFFGIPSNLIKVNIEDAFYPTILAGAAITLIVNIFYGLLICLYKFKVNFPKRLLIPYFFLVILISVISLVIFAEWYGFFFAQRKDEFYVIKNNGSDYILFVQGNGLYSAVKLNKKRTKTEGEIILLPSDSKQILKRVIIPNLNKN